MTRFEYGPSGVVSHWTAPYLPGVDETRRYGLEYDRALLRGMNVQSPSLLEEFVGFDGSPIRYDLSGALLEIPFSNQARTAVAVDKMGRPVSYTVSRAGEPGPYWSSGGYQFDGAGNIVEIGDQTFEYDGVGRLTQARVRNQAYTQGSGNFFVETYAFDIFGNMTEKTWAEENTAQQDPPLGAVFSHTFGPDPAANTNQIQTEGYRFDKNGNMTRFRHNDGPVAALWTAQNRMAAFYTGDPETTVSSPTERYTYDASGYRVLRFPESGSGLRVITLRDASGQPLAEYVDSPGSAHPRHAKDFVHGAGMLLMERWIDGSAPSATNTSPMAANGNVGLSVSAADPIETWAVDIRPEGGGASLVSGLEVDSEGKIWLPESNLTPDVTNYLRIRRDDGEAGAYSNAVTVAYDPDVNAQSANQVRAVSVSRSGTNVQVRWQLFQANGKALRLYYQRADGGGTLLLTPAGLASGTTTFSIQNQSLTVQCGYFYLTQQISGSNWSGPSPAAGLPPSGSSTEFGASQDCDPPSTPPPSAPVWVDTFHHRDHLGSLRIVTDAGGWMVGDGHDYYPFGMEMVPAGTSTEGGSRKRFTGHERDEASGLDYMLGRYVSADLARFVTADPVGGARKDPKSWNRFVYVRNSPMVTIDPNGEEDFYVFRPNAASSTKYWRKVQSQASEYGNTVNVWNGAEATVARATQVLATPGAHFIFDGHTVHVENKVGSFQLADGNLGTVTSSSGPAVHPSDVQAASVAVFGCDSISLSAQYSTAFTGVSSGEDKETDLGTLDSAALAYTDALSRNRDPATATSQANKEIDRSKISMDHDGDKVITIPSPRQHREEPHRNEVKPSEQKH